MNEVYVKVDGGIGRVIAATGVVESYATKCREKDVKVNVVSTYPQLFHGLTGISRAYSIGMPYLYEDYISKGEFVEPEPYNHHLYYRENQHLSTVFNFLLNGVVGFVSPRMVLTDNEISEAEQSIADIRKKEGKKIMLIQPWGSQGGIPLNESRVRSDESYRSFGWNFFKEFVAAYKDEYFILSVQSTATVNMNQQVSQFIMKGTMPTVNPDVRKLIACIPYVDLVVACDSFLHHASAALGSPVPTVVLWGGTDERSLGYEMQHNIRTVKDVLFEPNRVPHDHALYLNHNKNCNEFDMKEVRRVIAEAVTSKNKE